MVPEIVKVQFEALSNKGLDLLNKHKVIKYARQYGFEDLENFLENLEGPYSYHDLKMVNDWIDQDVDKLLKGQNNEEF